MARTLSLIVLVTLAGCTAGHSSELDSDDLVAAVQVSAVQRADLEERVDSVAHLQASQVVKVYAPVSERIVHFPYEDGDEIARGELLASIRSDSLDRGLEQMRAQIEGLDAQIEAQEADLARSRQLLEAGVLTPQAFDQAAAALTANQAQRRSLEASYQQLAVSRGYTQVVAPIDGVVAFRQLQEGDWASLQVPLATILDVDPLTVSLSLIEEDVTKVREGQVVEVRVDAWPGRVFTGEVERVMPWLDAATRTNTVEVELANPVDPGTGLRALKPGMYGTASLVVDHRADAIVVPERALVVDADALAAGGHKAFVVSRDGAAEERLVKVGTRYRDQREVLSGLDAGERVVVRGQHALVDGEPVRVVSTVASR